jgi:hypothetical protein
MPSEEPSIAHLNLKELAAWESCVPALAGFPSRVLVSTYDEFIERLYRDLDSIISFLQKDPGVRKNDSEDRLTVEIVGLLCQSGYNAEHDAKIGGHTDLSVRKNDFLWIGEAKIHSNYDYLWEGFLQLSTRYSTGDTNQKNGGLIIYIRGSNAKSVMDNWRIWLSRKEEIEEYNSCDCELRELVFLSTHKHERSGLPFHVRHMPVLLHFDPKDKSGRSRKT